MIAGTSVGLSTFHEPAPVTSLADPWLIGACVFLGLAGWRLVVMGAGFVASAVMLLVLAVLIWAYWQGSDIELKAWGNRARVIAEQACVLVWDILEAGREEVEQRTR